MRNHRRLVCFVLGAAIGATLLSARQTGQEPAPPPAAPLGEAEDQPAADRASTDPSNCSFFNPDQQPAQERRDRYWRSQATTRVMRGLAFDRLQVASATPAAAQPAASSYTATIDRNIFTELERQGVRPAAKTTDTEFLRRVTLDLTGRIPTRDRLLAFLNDAIPDKRERLVDQLLASPEYVDKWTMYLGDRFKNNQRNQNLARFDQGRNAFYDWIRKAVERNAPYDQMARDLISAAGPNTWTQGELNWLVGYQILSGPIQDSYDSSAVAIAETFLGVGHLNCILCHDGRGHLDSLSLWGRSARRYQGWELASFFSRVNKARSGGNLAYYWSLNDAGRTDYQLNTTTGNRPSRQPGAGGQRSVPPRYIFTDAKTYTGAGDTYRTTVAQQFTADPLFAIASVNYIWAEFFGRGLVEPLNQIDPARLDPDNPPPAPWTLQPSNARLLKELAADFASGGYRLRTLMRQIVLSDAYQLSARYDGQWNPAWEPLFARKLVRRLWAEEIHDAIAQSSGLLPVYQVPIYTGDDMMTRETRNVSFAMQFPEPFGMPAGSGSSISLFLDSFFRGDRDENPRSSEGSVLQSLNLMNDSFVMTRVRSVNTAAAGQSLLNKALAGADNGQAVDLLYQTVLSRAATPAERTAGIDRLLSGGVANRTRNGEDLLWTLYNKVDFIFNY